MSFETVILDKTEGIATITLNRPQKRNAFNEQMLQEFVHAKDDAAADPAVKVIVVTGAGTAFCAGYDFSRGGDPGSDTADAMRRRDAIAAQEKQMFELRRIPKPAFAMVNGPAIGAGLGFFLSCDLAIASEDATFGFGFVRLGLHPEVGSTYILPKLVGMARACELLFLGKTIDAREAEKVGLVNMVVAREDLERETRGFARRLAEGPSVAIGLAKISLYQSWTPGISAALENEARANAICGTTEDYREAVAAFREKRKPVFRGA